MPNHSRIPVPCTAGRACGVPEWSLAGKAMTVLQRLAGHSEGPLPGQRASFRRCREALNGYPRVTQDTYRR